MKTDVDSCLKDIASFYVKERRSMAQPELEAILLKHCESEAEVRKFAAFLSTEPGQLRFKTLLREKKGGSNPEYDIPFAQKLHGELMKEMKEPYAGLLTPGRFPKRDEALKKLGTFSIVEVHDDGDLTVRSAGKLYVVTTDGKTFEQASYLKEAQAVGKLWRRKGVGLYEEVLLEYKGEMLPFLHSESVPGKAYFGSRKCPITIPTERYIRESVWAPFYTGAVKLASQLDQLCEKFKDPPVAETECQIISPQYYDVLTWLNIPVPDYSFSIEPEVKERKIDEVLQKLKDGVSRIHESSVFREFLLTMAKFHDYSFGNQMLIMLQKPTATRVAGFVTWKDLGRHVKFGEKGISILAPCLPPTLLTCPLCGKPFTERELRAHLSAVHQRADISQLVREAREGAVAVPTPTYFKVVSVFDVSQTEGKPLPEIAVPVLSGAYSKELYDKLMALTTKYSLAVSFEPRPGQDPAIKGMLLGKDIWVKGDEPEAQRLKTLGHELAHYFTEAVYLIPRADAEVIAESVSFVVCAHFSFDSGIRSFPYVALWAKEKKVLEQNLASIRKISARMIEELA